MDRRGYCQLKEEALDRTMWRNRLGRGFGPVVWQITDNDDDDDDCQLDQQLIVIYLNINQLDALNFVISLFQASTCFEHMCLSSGGQNCTIQSLVSSHL